MWIAESNPDDPGRGLVIIALKSELLGEIIQMSTQFLRHFAPMLVAGKLGQQNHARNDAIETRHELAFESIAFTTFVKENHSCSVRRAAFRPAAVKL